MALVLSYWLCHTATVVPRIVVRRPWSVVGGQSFVLYGARFPAQSISTFLRVYHYTATPDQGSVARRLKPQATFTKAACASSPRDRASSPRRDARSWRTSHRFGLPTIQNDYWLLTRHSSYSARALTSSGGLCYDARRWEAGV